MTLFELFGDDSVDIKGNIKNAVMNFLTPYLAHGAPKISIKSIIKELRRYNFGIVINRQIITDLLNPDDFPMIKEIKGDMVYLGLPEPEMNKQNKNDKDKEAEKIDKTAKQQASKDVTSPPI